MLKNKLLQIPGIFNNLSINSLHTLYGDLM